MSPLSIALLSAGVLLSSFVVAFVLRYVSQSRAASPAPAAESPGIEAIGRKIDQALEQQQFQGETQRQMLAQKLDGVRESVENQRATVDGLRSELHHEKARRDAEIEEIRQQLGSLQQGIALPQASPAEPLALPPAPPSPEPAAAPLSPLPPEPPAVAAEPLPAPAPPPAPEPAEEPSAFGVPPLDGSFMDVPLTDAATPGDDLFSDFGFAGDSFATPSFLDVPAEPPTPPAHPAPPSPASPSDPFGAQAFGPASPADDPSSIFETAFFVDSDAPADSRPPAPDATGDSDAPLFSEAAFEPVAFEPVAFEPVAFEDAPAVPPAPMPPPAEAAEPPATATIPPVEPPADPVAAPAPPPASTPPVETSWVSRPAASDASAPPVAPVDEFFGFDMPADEPADEPVATPAEASDGLIDLDALMAAPAPAEAPHAAPEPIAPPTEPVPEAYVPPEGAERLTAISTIDDDTQRLLYQAGVLTLEEIAQWGRGDARRISSAVNVSEETIMNQWVFEAQAVLFRQYAERAAG